MEHDFLRKEEELRKQNKQLEMKTKEILQKVDDIVHNMRDFKLEDTKPIEPRELHLPKSVEEMGTKGMIHFYKTKIKALQEDLIKTQNELKIKNEELKKFQREHQAVAEEKEKWFLQYNVQKNANVKQEKQISAYNSKLQLKETENVALKKENEQLRNDLKNISSELSVCENRLKRTMQELEKNRTAMNTLRQEEKETKEAFRNNIKELTATVKQIQKHKNELLQGYKKQIQLINNLKKQKDHVESCKVLELAESDFLKLLEWKLD
ncbi:testis-expressed protein 9 [Tribolium madens]|uniref:testis-expressed protein 9 n=1 Tax=Tribolium madens TaxID=41895 RepID=UPI001CF7526C|nr:testis-expressed protein 9 [Tribolium madens]